MQKTIKITYGRDMRKLCVPHDVTFAKLFEDIQEIIPIPASRLAVKYRDDEGDMITVTTDRELQEAFAHTAGNSLRLTLLDLEKREPYKKLKELVLKLVFPTVQEVKRTLVQVEGAVVTLEAAPAVAEPVGESEEFACEEPAIEESELNEYQPIEEIEEAAEESEQAEGVYHEAYCNNCGDPIYNIRYKCANCDDYDLCENCEAAWSSDLTIHDTTHVFLKIYRPISTSYTYSLIDNLYELKEEETDDAQAENASDEEQEDGQDHTEEESESENESDISESSSSDDSTESSSSSDSDDSEEDSESEESSSSSDDSGSDSEDEEESEEIDLPAIDQQNDESEHILELKEPDVLAEAIDLLLKGTPNVVEEENLVAEDATPIPNQESSQEEEKKEDAGIGSSFFRAFQRFLSGGKDNQPITRADALKFLESMGFADTQQNEELLEQHNDDVSTVIDVLLSC